MSKLVLEKKAFQFRRDLGIGEGEFLNPRKVLSILNVITVFRKLSSNFSGMAIMVKHNDEQLRFAMINSDQSIGKQNFTICHELYHLFVQKEFNFKYCTVGQFDKRLDTEEYNADVFAAYVLMPEFGIKRMIPDNELRKNKIKIQTILKIEHYFSCSRSALLYRLKELSIIDSEGYEAFSKGVIRSAVQNGYSASLYKADNSNDVLGDYGFLANTLYQKDKLSETHFMTLLHDLGMNEDELLMNDEDLEKIMNG